MMKLYRELTSSNTDKPAELLQLIHRVIHIINLLMLLQEFLPQAFQWLESQYQVLSHQLLLEL